MIGGPPLTCDQQWRVFLEDSTGDNDKGHEFARTSTEINIGAHNIFKFHIKDLCMRKNPELFRPLALPIKSVDSQWIT